MRNKYCHYTSSHITRYTISCIGEIFICHYILSCIMTIFIPPIHEIVFLIIQDDV